MFKNKGDTCEDYDGTNFLLKQSSKVVIFYNDMRPLKRSDEFMDMLHRRSPKRNAKYIVIYSL